MIMTGCIADFWAVPLMVLRKEEEKEVVLLGMTTIIEFKPNHRHRHRGQTLAGHGIN